MLGALTVSPLLLTTEKRPVRSTTPVVKQGTNSPKTRRACMQQCNGLSDFCPHRAPRSIHGISGAFADLVLQDFFLFLGRVTDACVLSF